ncbi:MAG: tape measure protein [Lachnospiraceae bacterium]|nr:tape measure protein [Lachnospiraceae bacterium]
MATIQSSIALYDNFSPVLHNIMDAMNLTIAGVYDLQDSMDNSLDVNSFEAAENAIRQAGAAMESLERQAEDVNRSVRNNERVQESFNQEVRNGATASNELLSTIKKVAGAYLTIQGVSNLMELSDSVAQTEARLSLIVDDGGSVEELQQKIFDAAQDARADYMTTADAISKLGTQAGEAFASDDELIAFTTLLNKEFVNAGTSAQGIDSVMLQLTQSMAAGKLQGEELNAVLDNAAPIVSKIKTYLEEVQGIDATNIKELASEGVITADVIKNAMFYASDEINQTFDSMPMTFEQVTNSIKNNALDAFDPVLQKMNDIANSENFGGMVNSIIGNLNVLGAATAEIMDSFDPILQKMNDIANSESFNDMANGAIGALTVLGETAIKVVDFLVTGTEFIIDNWSWIGPIVYGVVGALVVYYSWQLLCAAGSAIMAAGMALLSANPILLIVMAIVVLIGAIYAVSAKIADMTGVAESGFGVICGAINVVIAFFINLGLTATNISLGITNAILALCGNMQTAFHNAICNVQSWFYNLLSTALTVIAGICEALNQLPFVEFDYSGITSKAAEYASKSAEAAGKKEEYESISDAFNKGMSTFNTFQDGWASSAFAAGAAWGDGISEKVSNAFDFGSGDENTTTYNPADYLSGLEGVANNAADSAGSAAGNTADISNNTADIADALDITNDELKYLRDIKEQEVIDRTVYRDIIVDIGEMKNTVKNEADLDGIASKLANHITEQIKISAEGV